MRTIILGLVFAAIALPASAQDIPNLDRLTGKYLYDAFVGKTMDGIYKRPRERSGTNVRNGKPISTNAWSAKTLIRGDVSTCDNLVS